jgi:Flp pilus assembly protein TadD
MRTLLLVTALIFALPAIQTAAAAGMDSQPAAVATDPDYESGKQAIEAKDWKLALERFNRAVARDPGNADIHNYLGYAHRQSGNLDAAFRSYGEALRLDPGHRGAHEYIGEAYLIAGNLAKAEGHLAALDRLCFFSCEEYRDLKKAVEAFRQRAKP